VTAAVTAGATVAAMASITGMSSVVSAVLMVTTAPSV
jgi:hypothetical protein